MNEEEVNKMILGNMPDLEKYLMMLSEVHLSQDVAKRSMALLRELFDKTYGWCEDCDGVVCKEKDCCLNK